MNIDSIINLIKASETLTELPRTGYILAGVRDPEKISSHSFNVVFLVMILGDQFENLNVGKALRLAVIHDLPESLITDLPLESKNFLDKNNAEAIAALQLFKNNQEFYELFLEYQKCQTLEARVVHDFDKLQMLIRAKIYDRTRNGDMNRFLSHPHEFMFDVTKKVFEAFCNLDE